LIIISTGFLLGLSYWENKKFQQALPCFTKTLQLGTESFQQIGRLAQELCHTDPQFASQIAALVIHFVQKNLLSVNLARMIAPLLPQKEQQLEFLHKIGAQFHNPQAIFEHGLTFRSYNEEETIQYWRSFTAEKNSPTLLQDLVRVLGYNLRKLTMFPSSSLHHDESLRLLNEISGLWSNPLLGTVIPMVERGDYKGACNMLPNTESLID